MFYCTGLANITDYNNFIYNPFTYQNQRVSVNLDIRYIVFCVLSGTFLNSFSGLFWCTFCRCEVGTDNWTQCNDHPIKICKYPVSGLFEGHSYYFRVRAVNSHGISKPSRMSDPIAALDPTEFEKLHGGFNWSSTGKCHLYLFLYYVTWRLGEMYPVVVPNATALFGWNLK